jgi:hypothetical protein
VLRLHPQVYLRLVRLYASFLEGRTDGLDLTVRPVPYFFVYSGATNPGQAASGAVKAGDPLKLAGTLTVHDRHGLPIDPVAVACVFDALLTAFPTLEPRAGLSTPATPAAGRQLNRIANFGAAGKRLRLADPHGQPHDGSQLQNLTPLAASVGLFSTTSTSITKATGAPPDLRLGPATNGLLGESFTLPTAPAGAPTLRRDFFNVMVVDVRPFLIGTPDPAPGNPAAALEPPPEVRHQETLTFALDGAMALGGANKLLGQTPPLTDAFAVAPALQGDFTLPADGLEATAHWPAFPPNLPAANDPIPGTLRAALAPSARFVSGSGSGADVQLTLNGLTAGQAVRVYNRVLLPDAREGRGDGAGAVVGGAAGTKGSVTVLLKDPLGIVERGQAPTIPTEATLHVDVVVVNSKGAARVFGNVTAPVQAPAPAALPAPGSNPFGSPAIDRGTAPAGLLGLTSQPLPSVANGPLAVVLALSGEGSPREAPRVPTMARRDAVVASASGTGTARTWRGQLSGAHLVPGAINSRHREGSPGSPGGRELQTVAVETSGGRLAYDLARAAVRRTRHLLPRLILVENDRWAPPGAAIGGTISGAVLQTIGAGAETPELTAFQSKLTGPDFPQTWAQVVDKVFDKLPDAPTIPKPLPDFLTNAIKKIHDDLVNSPNHVRMYEEFKRDCSATFHGRRDALWALTRALGAARELIYVEGPAFSATGYGTPAVPTDLVETIRQRLRAAPGLRVVLCLSKELDYGPGVRPAPGGGEEAAGRGRVAGGGLPPHRVPRAPPAPDDQRGGGGRPVGPGGHERLPAPRPDLRRGPGRLPLRRRHPRRARGGDRHPAAPSDGRAPGRGGAPPPRRRRPGARAAPHLGAPCGRP